ncbi:MFS transporter [Actinoplanes sp. OR16]|uniref:MFS transporter n=1 Tax=Actinoplanes sp. OR16 TaxID=946334 RepID=UPI000F709BDA|nr:MFS transporter [Actinoplanes sp. OR16]BBH67894.1 MFS transporter [Actinoplanes sp. OR16]
MTSTDSIPETAADQTRDRLVLAVLLTASFTLAVDFSILNVALPVIGADVGFTLSTLQWIATSFALCAAGFTLLFGRVADIVGRRRLFLAGIALLGVSSLAGGLATDPVLLLASRVAQGLATAAVTPAALSLLTTAFPEGPRRDRALGLNGALMAAGFTTGAILGGVVTDLLSWRWAFFINVVVAVLVLAVAPFVLAESRPARRPRLDVPGAATVTAGLLAVVFGLTSAGEHSWIDARAWGGLLTGVVLLAAFWMIEHRVEAPLVPVRILRGRGVAWGHVAGVVAFATETSLVFLLTLYLQEVLGYTPLAAGLSFAVLGVGTVLGGVLGPKVIASSGSAPRALALGLAVQAAATVVLILLGSSSGGVLLLLAATFAGGVANLVAIVGFMVTVTAGLPDEEQGIAAGLATMSQQIGITLGIPVMSAVVGAVLVAPGGSPGGSPGEAAGDILTAVRTAIGVNAALCVLTAIAVAVFLRQPRRVRARRG